MATNRSDESVQLSEESLRIDPQSVQALQNHGVILYAKRDYAEAAQVSERALAMEPGNESVLALRSRILEAEGRYDEALVLANDALKLGGNRNVPMRMLIIRLLALPLPLPESRRATEQLEAEARAGAFNLSTRDRGFIYLAQGRNADALEQFERALDERDPTLVWLAITPRVDPVRHEPRFKAIVDKVGPR